MISNSIDALDPYVPVYKVGSGEIDWIEALERMASKGKPVFSPPARPTIGEVQQAVHAILKINKQLVLMQCNTNYTASPENYDYINLNVLKTYASHVPGCGAGPIRPHPCAMRPVLGAVTLGRARHRAPFHRQQRPRRPGSQICDEPRQTGHSMVEETRLLERALGSADKFIAGNEQETAVVQRRCLRAARDIKAGETFTREMIDVLRPATPGAIKPDQIQNVIGTKALASICRMARNCAGRIWARKCRLPPKLKPPKPERNLR